MLLKTIVFILFIASSVQAQMYHKPGNCPLRYSVSNCMPRCQSDYQCSGNDKCCPNICGSTSCAVTSVSNTGSDGGYKGSFEGSSVYCNGQKCNRYEKCEYDRTARREKCVRT